VGPDGGVSDGEAEAAAPTVALTGRVGPEEPVEGLGRVGGGHAGAVVHHLEHGMGRGGIDTDHHRRAGRVDQRVPDEVGHDLAQAGLVAGDDHRVGGLQVERPLRGHRLGIEHRVGGHRPEVDGHALEGPALVQAGQVQQLIDERPHAHRLLLGPAHGLGQLSGVGQCAGAVQLGVAPDRGDGRAQLVRRVGDEPPQPGLRCRALLEGLLDAAEHAVERDAEVARLGPGGRVGDAVRQIAGGDRAGGGGHPAQRPDPEVDDPPRDQPEHGQHGEDGDALDHREPLHRVVDAVEGERDDQVAAEAALGAGQHPVADVAVGAADRDRLAVAEGGHDARVDDGGRSVVAVVRGVDGGELAVHGDAADEELAQPRRPALAVALAVARLVGGPLPSLRSVAPQLGARGAELVVDLLDEVVLGRAGDHQRGEPEHDRDRAHAEQEPRPQ
jgi:hypothetical protein